MKCKCGESKEVEDYLEDHIDESVKVVRDHINREMTDLRDHIDMRLEELIMKIISWKS